MKKDLSRKTLSNIQLVFIEAVQLGFTFPEIFAMLKMNAGHFSAWKRWNPAFKKAYRKIHQRGLSNRRLSSYVQRLEQSNGGHFKPSALVKTLIDARARLRTRADGCADGSIAPNVMNKK